MIADEDIVEAFVMPVMNVGVMKIFNAFTRLNIPAVLKDMLPSFYPFFYRKFMKGIFSNDGLASHGRVIIV